MENKDLNKSTSEQVFDLNLDALSTPSLEEMENGVKETDPPSKKVSKAKTAKEIGVPEGSPFPVSTNSNPDPLSGIEKFVQGEVEAGQPKLIQKDLNEYAPYFGNNPGYVTENTINELDKSRAYQQSGVEQFKNAVARVALNTIPEVAAQLGNAFDLEDYNNSDAEVGNWLDTAMRGLQEDVNESFPIYRENPGTPLDVTDSGWWFDNGSSLVTSMAGFVGAGYATSGLASAGILRGAKALQWLKTLGQTSELGAEGLSLVRGANTLTNALMLNQAESVGIGTSAYNTVYNKEIERLKGSAEGLKMTDTEIDKLARTKAATAASDAIRFNKWNILLNLSSANLFLKPFVSTRNLLDKSSLGSTLLRIGEEGLQEGVEETINMFAEDKATSDNPYGFKEAMERALSAEGVENFMLGFMGGAGQTALTKAGKALPIYDNTEYKNAYVKAYNSFSNSEMTDSEKSAEAAKIALEKVGNNKKYVSANAIHNNRYVEQQDLLARYNELSANSKIDDVASSLANAQEILDLQAQINSSDTLAQPAKKRALEALLLSNTARQAFDTGTTESLLNLYKGFETLSKEDAEKRGLNTEDEVSPEYYKTKAKNIQTTIKDLEKIYNRSLGYINSDQVYNLEEQNYNVRQEINKNLELIEEKLKEAEERYKGHPTLDIGNGNYRNSDTESGIDLNAVSPKFKKTPLYRQLFALNKTDKALRDLMNEYESAISEITSKAFQEGLRESIRRARVNEKKQAVKKEVAKRKVENKRKVNDLVEKLKEPQEVNTSENIADINTTDTKVKEKVNTTVSPVKEVESVEVIGKQPNNSPVFEKVSMPEANTAFDSLLNTYNDKNKTIDEKIDYFNTAYQSISSNLPQLASFISPLEGNILKQNVEVIKQTIEFLNKEKESDTSSNKLKQQAQEFIDSLDSPLVEETDSPDVSQDLPDFNKAQKQVSALVSLLNTMSELGVNVNDFRAVINSLEINTSVEEVRDKFDTIKYIYNLATGQRNEGTYEELMYDNFKREEVVNNQNRLRTYSIPTDTYTSDLDSTSSEILSTYEDLAKINGVNTESGAFAFEIYNETASNKLAYLAKLYNVNFTPQISVTGKEYISVSKEDINGLLNSMLDHRVLNPEIFSAGKEIRFVPLNEVTLEDGTIRYASESSIDNTPIGVEMDGTLVEGLYLHDVDWISANNVDNTQQGIIEDRNKLRAFRQLVMSSPSGITTKIISRTIGVPIINDSQKITTVADNTPELSIGIIRNGKVYTSAQRTSEIINKRNFKEGKGVLLVPIGNKNLALGVDRMKLQDNQIESMIKALELHLDGQVTDITKQLKNEFEIDILNTRGLEQYFNNFISLSKLKANDLNSYTNALIDIADNVSLAQFSNGELLYGTGQSIGVNNIKKSKNSGQQRQNDINHFREHLKGMYSHINLDLLGTPTKIPFITDNGIELPYETYDDYAKSIMISPYLGMTLNDGSKIYTIQSRIHFDIETPFKVPNMGTMDELLQGDEKVLINSEINKTIELPNGKTFNFDDVTDDDFSPLVEEDSNYEYLLDSVNLIKGLSVTTQNSIIKAIANDAYQELLDTGEINIKKQVKLSLDGFELIRERAYSANHPKKDMIAKQIDIIQNNANTITELVRKEFSKRKGISTIKTGEDSNNEFVVDEDEINNKSLFLENDYTVDPKTGLSDSVKQFLEGIRDKKLVRTENGVQYVTRTNLIGLNNYIDFDTVFNNLMSILSKNNDNTQEIDETLAIDDEFGENTPMYVKHILKTLQSHLETKPYLDDVITKVRDAEPHLQNAFATAFNKLHTNHIFLQSTYDSGSKSYSIRGNVAASRNTANLVLSEWQNNLKYSNLITVVNGKVNLNPNTIANFKAGYKNITNQTVELNFDTLNNWLGTIGIDIPNSMFYDLNIKGVKQDDGDVQSLFAMFTASNGIFKNIYNRVLEFEPNDVGYLDLDSNNLYEDGAFRNLAKLVTYYRSDLFNDSFKNGNGDTVYGFSNYKYVINRFLKLKSDIKLLENLSNDVFSRNSSWLQDLTYKDNGVLKINKNSYIYKTLKYYTSDSLKVRSSVIGKTIDKLNSIELEKYHLGLYMNNGMYLGKKSNPTPIMKVVYPTMSDKANTFVIQVPARLYSLTDEGLISEKTKLELVKDLIYPEVDRILAYQANKDAINIKEYKQGAGMFLLFPELNNITELWNEDGTLKDEVRIEAKYESIFARTIGNYFVSMALEKINLWKEQGIIRNDKNTKEDVLQYIDKSYRNNFNINTVEGIREFAVNYVINTTLANMNIQQLFIGDPASFFKGNPVLTADNQGKRLAGDNAGNNPIISDPNETFNTLVIKDVERPSIVYDYIKNLIGEELAEPYKNITASDAQGYVTLKEHLYIMFRKGEISKTNMDRILDTYNKTRTVSKADLKKVLQPMKPVYVNNIQRGNINPINTRLYLKYSSIPLIEEFTKGKALDGLRELMELNDIQLAIYESGAKIGMPSSIPSVFENNEFVLPYDWNKGLISNVPREGLGIQNEVPYDPQQRVVNDGTQQSKLLFTNILDVSDFINPNTGEKVNGRELSREYLNTYKELFKNKQNQLIKELDYDFKTNNLKNLKKLQKIIIQEGLGRGYSSNELQSFTLDELGENFALPLWLNNSSGKIEALLNSIVDNRVRQRKFRGKSFVLASGVGTNIISDKEADLSKVIKVGNWDGTLKGRRNENGEMTYAEVLIPFKFWDNQGNLLKIDSFLKDDGTLDLRKVPEKLLEIFGYRIPTSGLNLLSTIKVVGFLPDTMGDIIIAPDDFIVQMGSDFDVDKLYTHMYNTHYNSLTGMLEIINQDTLNKANVLKNSIKKLKDRIKSNDESDINTLNVQLDNLTSNDLLKLNSIENMILENKLLDIHKAVLNNPNQEVQKAITRPLSFGKLPQLAKEFAVNNVTKWFTPLSNTYQTQKYLSARAGKTAVGIFSLDMVFNSALQYVETPMHFTVLDQVAKKLENYRITIAGVTNNALNAKEVSGVKGKYKSEVIEGFMTAALDNEKEQLLGKLNINNGTFDFIRAMNQLGFDEEITLTLINQPIIKKILKDRELGIIAPEKLLTNQDKIMLGNTSIKEFKDEISNNSVDTPLQEVISKLFNVMSGFGKELKTIQSAINTDSTGIGKNIFYSMKKAEQITRLPYSTSILNAEKLIGDYINLNDDSFTTLSISDGNKFIKDKLSEGYVQVENMLINPNSLGGFAAIYGTVTNNSLWSKYFPYESGNIYDIISSVLIDKVDSPASVNDQAKEMSEIVNSYKSLLISDTYQLFSNYKSIYEARQDLLFDGENHLSLGSIIFDLKTSGKYTNLFLDRLQVGKPGVAIDIQGRIPTEIRYYKAGEVEMDDEQVIKVLADMIINNQSLGIYNGVELTTRSLVDKLITHQLITGGIQKSSQFIKHIPYSYLQDKGYFNKLNKSTVSDVGGDLSSSLLKQTFKVQYIQHNPEQYYKENDEIYRNELKNNKLYLSKEVSDLKPFIILKGVGERYDIYLYNNYLGHHEQIDNLGWKGMNEYNLSTIIGSSNVFLNQVRENTIIPVNEIGGSVSTSYVPSITDSANFLRQDRDTTNDLSPIVYNDNTQSLIEHFNLNDNNLSLEDKYRLILKEIKDNSTNPVMSYFAGKLSESITILSDVPIYIDSKLNSKGKLISTKILGEPLQIRINPEKIKSSEEMREVLIEEIIHGVLKSEISKESSPFVKSLNNIMADVKKQLIQDYGKETVDIVQDKLKNGKYLTQKERDLYYPLINLDEFIAATINNKVFQQYLNKSEATYTTKSLWQTFIKAITDLLERLGIVKDSNLEASLHEIINLFDTVNDSLHKELNRPKFVRSINYLNEKFNLVDSNNSPLIKSNAKEIADFINSTIVNIKAINNNGIVELQSNRLTDFVSDLSPNVERGIGGNLMVYIQTLNDRVKKLKDNIRKAKSEEDYVKVETLENTLDAELVKLGTIKETQSLVHLADKADEDMELVDTILKRPMNSEDIVYVRNIINFWKNAREYVFDERHNSSLPLATLYGGIESKAEVRSLQLFKIEKDFLEGEIKKYLGKDADIDAIFENYKDINVIQKNLRDISTYDNTLLNTIWASLKQANIDTLDEGNALLGDLDAQIDLVLPELRKLGNKELFEPYRQLSERGKATNHIVNPFNSTFYKEKAKAIRPINKDNTGSNVNDYVKWLRTNGRNMNIRELFPLDGKVIPEVIEKRNKIKNELGEGIYNYWFNRQQEKINKYNKSKEAYVDILLSKNNLDSFEELVNTKEAYSEYLNWTKRNSPYTLEEVIYDNKKFKDTYYNFRNKDYYEVFPSKEEYLDNNFKTIASNPILLDFYNKIDEVFTYLKKYVPAEQQKTLAYGGIPSIEKGIIEMYSERGLNLGFSPIGNMFIKSMQTSFPEGSATTTDILTGKAKRDLRIPIIKDSFKEIQNYIDVKSAEFLLEYGSTPTPEKLKEFEEDIVDEISRRNSFDLGKILKVYTSLTLAHKHKSKIEDGIKIANSILDSYQEIRTRPDGTPEVDRQTGAIQRKSKAESYLNTKESLDNFISNIMYGDVRDEEGKGKKIYTPEEKAKRAELTRLLDELGEQFQSNLIEQDTYEYTKDRLEKQVNKLGKTLIYSKVGDNILKYVQLKLMGWNVLGGVSNMGFGYIANQIEASGGQFFNRKELNEAYRMVGSSVIKNTTFNKVESEQAKKIRNGMNKWDVMKEASQELYTSSTPSSFGKSVQWLQPYNMNQRTEYMNQAPLMIALAKKTKVETPAGEISIWDGYDNNWNWDTSKYGEEPKESIMKLRMKIDQVIKRTHGNYDNLSPLLAKRKFLGRAASQFRTWLFESIATRFENERYDDVLDAYVKGRYRSVGTVFTGTKLANFAPELIKGILKQWSLGMLFKNSNFNNLVDGETIKEIDAINMNKVAKEITFALNIYLFLLLLMGMMDDDDDKELVNILFNQGTRLKTDLVMYLNPMEARNIIKDPIPSMSVVKDVTDWLSSVGGLFTGTDEVKAGVHAGDSRFISNSMKLIPFSSKAYSIYNSGSQAFDKN